MSIIKAQGSGEVSTGFYPHSLDQSLRFNDGDSAHLYRTTSGTPSSTTSTVFSCWVKRSKLGAIQMIWTAATTAPSVCGYVYFNASDQIQVYLDKSAGGSDELNTTTTAKFRDVSSWYGICVVYNTADSTTANKSKIYVNGVQQAVSTSVTGSAVTTHRLLDNGVVNTIGKSFNSSSYFDGYLAEFHVVDGVAGIDYDDFGETKDGVWVAKSYSGGHGNNGYYLPFDDSSAIGDDESSNTNDFTVSGLVATDVVPDSPTNNFATLNPLEVSSTNDAVLSNGNLIMTPANAGGWNTRHSTAYMSSGKWYVEYSRVVNSGDVFGGIIQEGATDANYVGYGANGYGYHVTGVVQKNASNVATGLATYGTDDVIGIALDMDNGTVQWSKNGTLQGSALTGLTGAWGFAVSFTVSGTTLGLNFGQDSSFAGNITSGSAGASDDNGIGDFFNAPPSGFLALASSNLPEPTIIDGTENFSTVLYTGNSGSQAVSGVGFSPDFVWIKPRNLAANNVLHDTVRDNPYNYLISNGTNAENTNANFDWFKSFDSDGFTVAYSSSNSTASNNWNGNYNYVAWNWLAGTAFSNDASATSVGTIDSDGQVNTTAGFSIIKWAGTGSNGTLAHGLTKAPELIIVKNRDAADEWPILETVANGGTHYLRLNSTAASTSTSSMWNNTNPTDSVFSLGTYEYVNASGENYISYIFHSVEGYSKVGSYTGNGNADGPFVFTGFRPAWVMFKRSDSADSWFIADNKRNVVNPLSNYLFADLSNAENTSTDRADFLSNGFKVLTANGNQNASGGTYIYLAFAEQPFKFANAR